jgi:FkbM family methyltransferase
MLETILRLGAKILSRLHRITIRCFAKLFSSYRFKSIKNELFRVEIVPRQTEFDTYFDGQLIRAVDSEAYVALYEEIFSSEIYRFEMNSAEPSILDCGANIGMSVLYFKKLYPAAKIVAFEPDPKIFDVLQNNIQAFDIRDVTLVPKGVWASNGRLRFVDDPVLGLGGHIVQDDANSQGFEISVIRLRDYLGERVDFLKLDIEGAECEVLEDCADQLSNIGKIFIEYHSFVDRPQCLGRLLSILADAGFRVHLHCAGAYSHTPFVRFDAMPNGMDMQLNIFGVRQD